MSTKVPETSNISGDKLYQQRARKALPILVRQAASKNPIYYKSLALELGMPNPRNLNYVLGSIGVTINELSPHPQWGEIPHIESLVINQQRGVPGEGFEGFLAQRDKSFTNLPPSAKRAYLDAYWQDVYAFPYWQDVLAAYGLPPASPDATSIIEKAKTGKSGGGGEGEEHRKLKEYVSKNPHVVGLPTGLHGKLEAPLPSGDKIDVLFSFQGSKLAVEVKSRISNDVDLTRGIFQCVKYRAVMEAERGFQIGRWSVDAILVVGRKLPKHLEDLRNSTRVRVIEVSSYD